MSRLMLVDDEPEVVNLLSVILTMYGYEVAGYTDAAKALQEAPRVRPDLLLVDLIMPGMDGLSLVAAFDRDARLAGTPVLMLTGLSSGEVTIGGSQRGPGVALLEKPCEPEMIAAEVTRLLHEAQSLPDYRHIVVAARKSLTHGEGGLPEGAGMGDQPPRNQAA